MYIPTGFVFNFLSILLGADSSLVEAAVIASRDLASSLPEEPETQEDSGKSPLYHLHIKMPKD